ncbi:MAG TPA: hypothetical protein VJA21_28380 [Verrucomicrobiae bacterium]
MKLFGSEWLRLLVAGAILTATVVASSADQVEMQNGDRYNGKVLSLDGKSLILDNAVLGKIALPRDKVAVVTLGAELAKTAAAPATNSLRKAGSARPVDPALADLASHSNLIQQVQRQFLAGADPAAQQKFNDLVSGMLSGTVTLQDLQREARSAADQVRALKKELGPDAGFALDGYLAILDRFLKESPAAPAGATNSPAPKTGPE